MALLTIDQNPSIADTVLFSIQTPDVNGCFLADPYKVDSVKIYYIERDITNGNISEYTVNNDDPELVSQLAAAKAIACASPTTDNLNIVSQIENQIALTSTQDQLYFSDCKCVQTFGQSDTFPAWLSSDQTNAFLIHVTEDENSNPLYGNFQLEWNPLGMREGDYFICWTWTPLPSGEKLTAQQAFSLAGATQLTTSIPTHFTDPKKYKVLQERYLPEVFKMVMGPKDLSPVVIKGFNDSVADGFTTLENLANQMVDMLDANAINESMLTVLGNIFGLKLRSTDPTLWRRQIKRAVPLYKKKGTLGGIKEALAQAGIRLCSMTRLWQVISKYTWQDGFEFSGTSAFVLSYQAVLPADENFQISILRVGSSTWQVVGNNYVEFVNSGTITTVTWVGDSQVTPISLNEGDWVLIRYKVNDIPTPQQSVESYIQTLDLADQRDQRLQQYPLKNWNVRVIEENDALFNSVIPQKNPFYDPIIYGWVRTEFPYSENIYNMEEYNGSKIESKLPCNIDSSFLDPCSQGISSKYNVELEVVDLSDDRINEAKDILEEYTPFHAVVHSMQFFGSLEEFVQPPTENITFLTRYRHCDVALADAQMIFNRTMDPNNLYIRGGYGYGNDSLFGRALGIGNLGSGFSQSQVVTDMATDLQDVVGTISNAKIVLYCPDVKFDDIGLNSTESLTYLEVLSPSLNAGIYTVANPHKNTVDLPYNTDPIYEDGFSFRLSNEQLRISGGASITPDNIFAFSAEDVNVSSMGIKSQWDVNNDPNYSGGPWNVTLPTGTYNILQVLPDGSMLLLNDGTLYSTNQTDLTYSIKSDSLVVMQTGNDGDLNITLRGRVDIGGGSVLVQGQLVAVTNIEKISNVVQMGNYVLYSGSQYPIISFVEDSKEFYISGYSGSSVSGVSIVAYQRLLNNVVGYFAHEGIKLSTLINLETTLGIVNGSNPPANVTDNDLFKENFLLLISTEGGTEYYAISSINGTNLTLSGTKYDWGLTGERINFGVVSFQKNNVNVSPIQSPPVPGNDFRYVSRQGGTDVFSMDIQDVELDEFSIAQLTAQKGAKHDLLKQKESITFTIERKHEQQ